MAIERASQSPNGPRAISIGAVASRVLRTRGPGHVAAVFERSCYLEFASGMICLGPRGLGNGPLNLLLDGPLPRLAREAQAVVAEGVLSVGSTLVCELRTAAIWLPTIPDSISVTALAAGLAAFAQALPVALPAEGLAGLLRSAATPDFSPVLAAAHPPAQRLQDFVGAEESSAADLASSLSPLLGLGPGLTPSGDDYLGGAMIALTLLRQTAKREAMWQGLRALVPSHTTTISAAHLAAAAEGLGSEAVHRLLDDILAGGTPGLPRRLANVAAIGHTSGWDALAGAVSVLRAELGRVTDMARLRDASCGCAAGRFVKT